MALDLSQISVTTVWLTLCYYIIIPYHIFTLIVLIKNLAYQKKLNECSTETVNESTSVDILIPCRNEAHNIHPLLESLFDQDYPFLKVYIYDDESTDQSLEIINEFIKSHPDKFFTVPTKAKPNNWLGKSWACYQLAKNSTSPLMLFIDADTMLAKVNSIRTIMSLQNKLQASLLSIWPNQIIKTFGLQLTIPWVYRSIFTHLPLVYQNRKPKWMPSFLYKKTNNKFGAANGQCMLFKRSDYQNINPHEVVKSSVLEDVKIAKLFLTKGLSVMNLFDTQLINCRMYLTVAQAIKGFRKNMLEGFNNSVLKIIFAALWFVLCYLCPFLFLYDITLAKASAAIILLNISIDVLFRSAVGMKAIYSPFSSLGVLVFSFISIASIMDYLKLTSVDWKGRKLNK